MFVANTVHPIQVIRCYEMKFPLFARAVKIIWLESNHLLAATRVGLNLVLFTPIAPVKQPTTDEITYYVLLQLKLQ